MLPLKTKIGSSHPFIKNVHLKERVRRTLGGCDQSGVEGEAPRTDSRLLGAGAVGGGGGRGKGDRMHCRQRSVPMPAPDLNRQPYKDCLKAVSKNGTQLGHKMAPVNSSWCWV